MKRAPSWPKERVEALEALIWKAYGLEGDIRFESPHPDPARHPDRITSALQAEPDAAAWTDRDRSDAVAIALRIQELGSALYDRNVNACPEDLAALLPGISLKLCDAWLGYMGATRH